MTEEHREAKIGPVQMPEYLKATYANFVSVNHTPWDFRLTFAIVRSPLSDPGDEDLVIHPEGIADILLPANLIHGLIAALQENFGRYLDVYGPPGLEPEGPGRRE